MGNKNHTFIFATVGGTYIDFPFRFDTMGHKRGLVESKSTEEFIRSNSMTDMADRNWKHVKDVSQSSDGMGVLECMEWEYMYPSDEPHLDGC